MGWRRRNGGFSLVQCPPKYVGRVSPARRGARASEAHVLGLDPRESERRDAQARYTRKPPRAVTGRAGTWEHRLAPKELRLSLVQCPSIVRGASVASAARRARAESARAGPRPQRERAQRRASALHAQDTSRSEGQGWRVEARAGAEGTAASRPCSALPWCVEQVSPARRGARARRKRVCWASSQERASAVARKPATRASHLAQFPEVAGKTNRCGSTRPRNSAYRQHQNFSRKQMSHTRHSRVICETPSVLNCSPSRPPGNYLSMGMERRFPEVAGRPVSNALRALSLQ